MSWAQTTWQTWSFDTAKHFIITTHPSKMQTSTQKVVLNVGKMFRKRNVPQKK